MTREVKPLTTTFVLPGGGPSGGIRVTVEMAKRLSSGGHQVRIAFRSPPLVSKRRMLELARRMLRRFEGAQVFDWLEQYPGPKEAFTSLQRLNFDKGEIVIAVGELTVCEVSELKQDVFKVRYCHGFFDELTELNQTAWGGPMPTICVSTSLVSRLEAYSGRRVFGVVPNGLNLEEYYPEDRVRNGVGLIYHQIPVKGPEVARALVKGVQKRYPGLPWYVFGTARRPVEFDGLSYLRYPSVAKARGFYSQCKVWFVTSRNEGFCLPILEAMACGSAVISSDHSNARDLIQDGVNGFVVPYGDVNAYLERLEVLSSNEAQRQKLASGGFKTVRQFGWDAAVAKMVEVLEAVRHGEADGARSAV